MRLKITSETGEPIHVTKVRDRKTRRIDPSMVYLDIGGYPTVSAMWYGKIVRVCARCGGRGTIPVDNFRLNGIETRSCPACQKEKL